MGVSVVRMAAAGEEKEEGKGRNGIGKLDAEERVASVRNFAAAAG